MSFQFFIRRANSQNTGQLLVLESRLTVNLVIYFFLARIANQFSTNKSLTQLSNEHASNLYSQYELSEVECPFSSFDSHCIH